MKAIVSEKGQVTIPKGVRDRLGLRPGTVLSIEAIDGKLVGRKVDAPDLFARWRGRGRLPGAGAVDAYLRLARDAHRD
jgi:antitoxin PrlF